ncbi:putative small-subunit processome, Utp21 protein [Helianthus annuus]|nr:putative small-subunit processome, Utp21 protein [Helianthus annuus]
MFSGATNIDSYGSGKEVVNVKLPSVSSGGDSKDDVDSDKPVSTDPQAQAQAQPVTHTPLLDQQIPDLVTLSLLPKSQWQSLINLDIIKARNKPIEPPKKPENAPFFLPSIPSLSGEIVFKASEPMDEEKPTHDDKFTRFTDLPSSPFVQFLQSSVETKNFEAFTDYLKSLSSSTLDVELRMLQIIDDDDEQEPEKRPELITLEQLLDYFIHEISHRNNFEFIQALIRLFLKIHGESIRRQSKLQGKAQKLLEVQSAVWQKLDGLFQSARCMVTFLSNSQF